MPIHAEVMAVPLFYELFLEPFAKWAKWQSLLTTKKLHIFI